ncbi:hypothetical protein V5O48_019481, partial [Marasmius crinis-equi]
MRRIGLSTLFQDLNHPVDPPACDTQEEQVHQNPSIARVQSNNKTGQPHPVVTRATRLDTIAEKQEEQEENEQEYKHKQEDKQEEEDEPEHKEQEEGEHKEMDMDVDQGSDNAKSGSGYSESQCNGIPGQGRWRCTVEEDDEEEGDDLEHEVVSESPEH